MLTARFRMPKEAQPSHHTNMDTLKPKTIALVQQVVHGKHRREATQPISIPYAQCLFDLAIYSG